MPGTMLNILHAYTHISCSTTLCDKYYYPHFPAVETEAQKG